MSWTGVQPITNSIINTQGLRGDKYSQWSQEKQMADMDDVDDDDFILRF